MRLHRLQLTAFGPFAGTETVDFDELSAAGLFLLHGPTGAGKTSVLDGVCFALYGQVPGARPATRLRSDHAAAGTATEVLLELTVGGRRLEITRRPEQPRAKKRGSGTTMDKAVTLLREWTGGEWRALSKSHQEIGEEVRQLVGMSCEQFCQVVLLPQGEFATFLRASAIERAALLGRLFDTRRFKAVESWLRDRRQEAAHLLAQGDQELGHLAERLRQAAGPAAEAELPADAAADLLPWAAVLRCTAREQHEIVAATLRGTEAAHDAASAAAAEERDLHALQTRHAQAVRRATTLAETRATRTSTRTTLTRAHRAATVEHALAAREKTATRAAESAAAEHAVTADLATAGELPAVDRAPAPQVPAARGASGRGGAPTVPAEGAPAGAGVPEQAGLEREGALGAVPEQAGLEREGAARPETDPGGSADPVAGSTAGERAGAGRRGDGVGQDGAADGGAAGPVVREPEAVRLRAGGEGETGAPGGAGDIAASSFGREGGGGVVAQGGRDVGGAVLLVEPLVRRVGELREELGGLAQAGEVEGRVEEIHARRIGLDREERVDEGAVREADGWLAEWPAVRDRLQARLDAAGEAVGRAGERGAELEAARRRSAAAGQRDRLSAELRRAEDDVRDARDLAAQARESWQDLRQARIDGIAAELAAQLTSGEPCRVCGSPEHPAPARPAPQQVTRADEDAAGAAYERAAADHEAARAAATRLAAALDAATATAGDAPLAELTAACAVLEAEHADAAREAAGLSEARRALESAGQERDRRTAQRHDALSRAAARTSRREELDEQHARLSAELDRARAGHPSVADRRGRLSARIALLDRAVHAVRYRAESAARHAEAEAALVAAAARAGFATPEEAAAALLPAEQLWSVERQVEQWAREEAAVEADLAAPEPAAAALRPPADPAAAQAAASAATDRLRAASAAESAAEQRTAELDRLSAEAAATVRELAPARAEFTRIARLSDLASATTAENRYRMELETYVLAARLEQVAAAAGVRLQRMSAGRYTLVHTDARSGGRGKSGLGLMVVDAWTGTERDTATLSGGETFFASLALALGLADVVTDEAGGVRLDTLFIDEGFGSLDDQTLDEVLDVLDGLRERDRAVGIVSHVADLRHRIPAQLRVVKGREGSTVRLRTASRRAD
ncbi:AAA family ATPase [Streptomyces sp. CA-111067]|uniref:AAA family ATPase n=1 Tax=Streptomyces sp. CA-111067 TaxID=3240046 RepID=UPI003D96BBB2